MAATTNRAWRRRGNSIPSAWNRSPILLQKLKLRTKSQIELRQAGTKADRITKDEDLFVSPTFAKPRVEPTPTVKTLQYPVKAITFRFKIGQMNLSVFKRLKSSAKISLIICDLQRNDLLISYSVYNSYTTRYRSTKNNQKPPLKPPMTGNRLGAFGYSS